MNLAWLARRLAGVVLTFAVIVAAVFGLLRLAPGGPFDGERALPPEVEANLRAAYHLDEPLPKQFARYVAALAQGDLGPSFRQKDFTVNDLVARGLPVSATLGAGALVIAVCVGLWIGIGAGLRPGSRRDALLMSIASLGIALPPVIAAPVLVMVVAVFWQLLPAGGIGTPAHFVLPVLALALPYTAAVARLTRGSVVETLSAPHLLTAAAKGLPQRRVLTRHILPLALLPVLSYLGPMAAGLLAGSVVVEQVFDLPGIGRYFVQGAINRDYTLVMGVTLVYAALVLLFNLAVDLLYGRLDPRIRLAR